MAAPLPFTIVNDFRLESVVQDSPYSMAVKAVQPSLKRAVFVKLLKPHIKNHTQWAERFRREAQVCARLKHPHIVDVYTVGEHEGYTYMALQYVNGLSLKELLEKEGILPPAVSLEIIRQVLLGLAYAHENGVIHRDIKPGNIMLDIQGQVQLTDFGLAYLGEDASLTQQGNILGTPAYMSPEQITGEPLSPASDFFAVGATLYEMLTGVKPFAGENYSACIRKILNENPVPPSLANPGLAEAADQLVIPLLEKDPMKRPSRAEEILQKIKNIPITAEESEARRQVSSLVKKYYSVETPVGGKVGVPEEKSGRNSAREIEGKRNRKPAYFIVPAALLVLLIFLLWQLNFFGHPDSANHPNNTLPPSANISGGAATADSSNHLSDRNKLETNSGTTGSRQANKKHNSQQVEPVVRGKKDSASEKGTEILAAGKSSPQDNGAPETAAETNPENANRSATPTYIYLEIDPWGSVSLDGREVDSMAHIVKLPVEAGKHRLLLSHPEFPPKIVDVDIIQGESKQVNYSFLENAGYLRVEVRPWADVYIDGKKIDTTPLDRPIATSAGEHLLELKHPDYPTFRQIVQVSRGDTLTIKKALSQ